MVDIDHVQNKDVSCASACVLAVLTDKWNDNYPMRHNNIFVLPRQSRKVA